MPEPMSTSDEEGSESEEEAEVKVLPKKAGKKRAAEEAEEVEKPAKKAKASAVKEVGLLDFFMGLFWKVNASSLFLR